MVLVSEPVWSVDLGSAIVSNPLLAIGFLYVGTIDVNCSSKGYSVQSNEI
jgi:hypothetical protein